MSQPDSSFIKGLRLFRSHHLISNQVEEIQVFPFSLLFRCFLGHPTHPTFLSSQVPYFSSSISFEFESLAPTTHLSTFVDESFTDDHLLAYMQEVADVAEETPEPAQTQKPALADFQFPELAADDAKIEVVKDIHRNLSGAVSWRRAHFRFASMLAHLYAVRDPMAAAFVAGVVHRSVLRVAEGAMSAQSQPDTEEI